MKLKVCLVAPPSCGKTTTAREIVKTLKKTHKINAEVAEEYARKYIRDNFDDQHPLSDPHQQYPVFLGQIETERNVSKIHDVTICDSASFLSYIYAKIMVNNLSAEDRTRPMYYKVLKDIHEMSLREADTYDRVFLLEPSGEIFQDGVRAQQGEEEQLDLFNKIKGFLDLEEIPYIKVPNANVEGKAAFIVDNLLSLIEECNTRSKTSYVTRAAEKTATHTGSYALFTPEIVAELCKMKAPYDK